MTEICATTDEHALHVHRAAAEAHRQIDHLLAVVSIDGTAHTAYLTRALTVVAAPLQALAVHTVRALLTLANTATDGGTVPISTWPARGS